MRVGAGVSGTLILLPGRQRFRLFYSWKLDIQSCPRYSSYGNLLGERRREIEEEKDMIDGCIMYVVYNENDRYMYILRLGFGVSYGWFATFRR